LSIAELIERLKAVADVVGYDKSVFVCDSGNVSDIFNVGTDFDASDLTDICLIWAE